MTLRRVVVIFIVPDETLSLRESLRGIDFRLWDLETQAISLSTRPSTVGVKKYSNFRHVRNGSCDTASLTSFLRRNNPNIPNRVGIRIEKFARKNNLSSCFALRLRERDLYIWWVT